MPHIHEKVDFTVEVFVVHEGRVLLRKHDKYKIWLSVGGHVELDEDPNEAAVREVLEEVGLDVRLAGDAPDSSGKDFKELVPPKFMNRHRINATHEHVTLVYFATSESDELRLSDDERSEDCRWFTREEIEDLDLRDNIRTYAIAALQELS
jgi:8-oxo-dGTP pyrophosphatase MutT (NUDIX family)